jgi:hypothetical protein
MDLPGVKSSRAFVFATVTVLLCILIIIRISHPASGRIATCEYNLLLLHNA